jgi:predicted small secreted protein
MKKIKIPQDKYKKLLEESEKYNKILSKIIDLDEALNLFKNYLEEELQVNEDLSFFESVFNEIVNIAGSDYINMITSVWKPENKTIKVWEVTFTEVQHGIKKSNRPE